MEFTFEIYIINKCYPNEFNFKNSKTQTEHAVKQLMEHDPAYVKTKTKHLETKIPHKNYTCMYLDNTIFLFMFT